MDLDHYPYIHKVIEVARLAREHGNHPFGALLIDPYGKLLLSAENTVVTDQDCTAHAELNLVRKASRLYDRDYLADCTLYASTEPCPMCAGAIFWCNIRKVVFGLSETSLYQLIDPDSEEILPLSCREVFNKGEKRIDVLGPLLENEARQVHLGFWT